MGLQRVVLPIRVSGEIAAFVLVGGGLDFKMGRALKYPEVAHNRFLLALAHAIGHPIERFGNPDYCGDGALTGLS